MSQRRTRNVVSEYEELHHQHYKAVLKHARRLGPPRHQEDAVQEAFLALYKRLEDDGPEIRHPRAWLKGVVHRKLRASYKRECEVHEAETEMVDAAARIETSRMDEALVKTELREALLLLNETDIVLVLGQNDGLSYEELGAEVGLTHAAVRTRIHRARKQLKVRLERDAA